MQAVATTMNQYFRNDGFSDPVIFQYSVLPEEPEEIICSTPQIGEISSEDNALYEINWEGTEATYYVVKLFDFRGNLLDSIETNELYHSWLVPDGSQNYRGVVEGHCSDTLYVESSPFVIGSFHTLDGGSLSLWDK